MLRRTGSKAFPLAPPGRKSFTPRASRYGFQPSFPVWDLSVGRYQLWRARLEERCPLLAARTFVGARWGETSMEQPSPIGLPSQRPAPVRAAAMDLDRPAGSVVGLMDER